MTEKGTVKKGNNGFNHSDTKLMIADRSTC